MIKEKPKCPICEKYLERGKEENLWTCKKCGKTFNIEKQCPKCSRYNFPVYLTKHRKDWKCLKCKREFYEAKEPEVKVEYIYIYPWWGTDYYVYPYHSQPVEPHNDYNTTDAPVQYQLTCDRNAIDQGIHTVSSGQTFMFGSSEAQT